MPTTLTALILSLFAGDPARVDVPSDTPPAVSGLVPSSTPLRELPGEAGAPEADSPQDGALGASGSAPPEEAPSAAFLGVRLGAAEGARVRVIDVVEGGPAAAAGLRAGDRLLAIDGEPVTGAEAFANALRARRAGEQAVLEVVRDGRVLELRVTFGAAPQAPPSAQPPFAPGLLYPNGSPALPQWSPLPLEPQGQEDGVWPFRSWFQWPPVVIPPDTDSREQEREWGTGWSLPSVPGAIDGLEELEQGLESLRRELDERFEGFRRQFGRDLEGLRRDFQAPDSAPRRLWGGVGPRLQRVLPGARGGFEAVPPEALEDLAERLAPLDEERQNIVRRWAEDHGQPGWAERAPRGDWHFEFHRTQVVQPDDRVRELENEVQALRRRLAALEASDGEGR